MGNAHGRIVTFYSYKGGTGRSMALANFAWIVAVSGKRVLTIDWDLEAPGLHRYFRPFLVDPDLFETDGLIDAFWSFAASASSNSLLGEGLSTPEDQGEVAEGLEDATRRLDWTFPTGGYIDFIGAGRQGATYSERVNSFDWKRFYELGGARMLTTAKAHLRARYDWVLIDSRTGVSDTSGICTMQMPDMVVPCFTLNRQSIEGVAAILRSIRAYHSASVDGSKIKFFPVATRIENAEQNRLEVARGYARAALAEFLPIVMQARPRDYWDKMEISYRPAYAFEEILAAFGDSTGPTGAADTMLSQVETMAQHIAGDAFLSMPEIVESDRERVLARYSFGTRSTPVANVTPQIDDDSADTEFLRGVRGKEQLWRGSKFDWRLLLSRRELELLTDKDRSEFGRNMTFYLLQSERMRRFLRTTGFGGMISFILGLVAILVYWLLLPGISQRLATVMFPLILISGWISGLFVWSIIMAAVSRDKPYGITLAQTVVLSAYGPFLPEIGDYGTKNVGPIQ